MFEEITKQARQATEELVQAAHLKAGDIFVVGCSTSEVAGHKIGSYSNKELAEAIFSGIYPVLLEKGIYLAAQCCEHLNRSLVIERAAAEKYGYEEVPLQRLLMNSFASRPWWKTFGQRRALISAAP